LDRLLRVDPGGRPNERFREEQDYERPGDSRRVGEIVEEIAGVPVNEVTPGKSFVGDLDIDSLSMVEIAVAAQDKFGVEIPDDELKDLTTVQDVVTYVATNSGRSA
jgi:acyl carrier protein